MKRTSARALAVVLAGGSGAGAAMIGCTLLNPLGALQSGGDGGGSTLDTSSPPVDSGTSRESGTGPRDSSSPSCEAGLASCSSGCTDTNHDPHNCGRCGHDCQGGGCDGGACMPVAIASGLKTPWVIVSDSTHVYFTETGAGTIDRCPLSGCDGGPEIVASGLLMPRRLALDSASVYFTDNQAGVVGSCPLDGCPEAGPNVLASGLDSPVGVAVTASLVVWTQDPGGDPMAGTVNACPLSGCGDAMTTLAPANGPGTLVIAGTTAMWVNNPANTVLSCDVVAGCGGAPSTLASGLASPYFLAVGGSPQGVYWSDNDSTKGAVLGCLLATGCASSPTILANDESPVGIAVDDSGVYWVTQLSPGSVRMCPLSGCPGQVPITLAAELATPFDIALSPTSVYWTNSLDGTVMMLAKP